MEKKSCNEKVCRRCGWCCTHLGMSVDISLEEDKRVKRIVFESSGVVYIRPISRFFLSFSPENAKTLKSLAKKLNIKADIRPNKLIYDKKKDKVIIYDFFLNHNVCPFYNKKEKSCRIYNDRPVACRKFPNIDNSYSKEVAGFIKKKGISFEGLDYEEALKKCKSFCKLW